MDWLTHMSLESRIQPMPSQLDLLSLQAFLTCRHQKGKSLSFLLILIVPFLSDCVIDRSGSNLVAQRASSLSFEQGTRSLLSSATWTNTISARVNNLSETHHSVRFCSHQLGNHLLSHEPADRNQQAHITCCTKIPETNWKRSLWLVAH